MEFKKELFLNFILGLLVPLISMWLIFGYADIIVKRQVQESATQSFDLYYEQMEDIAKYMRSTCLSVLANDDLRIYASGKAQTDKMAVKRRQSIYKFLNNLMDSKYQDLFVYCERDGRCISGKYTSLTAERYYDAYYGSRESTEYKEQFLEMLQTENKQTDFGVFQNALGEDCLCMLIRVPGKKDIKSGYTICTVLSTEYLNSSWIMRGKEKNDIFITCNSQNQVVVENRALSEEQNTLKELLNALTETKVWSDGTEYMLCRRDSEIVKSKYLYAVPNKSFWNELSTLRIFCAAVSLLCIAISLYVIYCNTQKSYDSVENMVRQIQNKSEKRLKEFRNDATEHLLYTLLCGKQNCLDGINLPYANIVIVLFEIESVMEEVLELRHFIIKNVFEELGNQNGTAYFASIGKERCAILMNLDGNMEEVQTIVGEGRKFVSQNFQMLLSVGLSRLHRDRNEVHEAYAEAQEALQYRFLMNAGAMILYEDISSRNLTGQGVERSKIYALLLDYVKNEKNNYDVEMFIENLGHIFEINEEISIDIAYAFKNEVIMSLGKLMLSNGYEKEKEQQFLKKLKQTDTLLEFKLELLKNLVELRSYYQERKPKTDICEKAKAFIDEHYDDCQLSVSMLGEKMGMQSAYLSKLFKENYGMTILDYIAQVRVEKAKAFMREQKLSVQDAAEKAGFVNSHAFIRVFKKLEEITPGRYKELCQNGEFQ